MALGLPRGSLAYGGPVLPRCGPARGHRCTMLCKDTSKKELLKFAVPALGISIASPLMTNIDNAFVGRLSGTQALASMSPGTVLADYILYLFIFLPRATTGLVARGLQQSRGTARRQLSVALSAAGVVGLVLSGLFVFATPWLMQLLDVAPELRPGASIYVQVRGFVAWAALMQSVALAGLLAARDSVTPLKVVLFAAALNFLGDFLLCACRPWGIFGAALATSVSTLLGFGLMWRALKRNHLAPVLSVPKRSELAPLLEYARPLSVVILFRFLSITLMAKAAAALGTQATAAYQVLCNMVVLFGLCGEPLSQTAQTMLPGLLERPSPKARGFMKSLAVLTLGVSLGVGVFSAVALRASAHLFTRDVEVQQILRSSVMVPVTVASLILSQAFDGSMLAAREFPLVIRITLATTSLQAALLIAATTFHWSLEAVFLSLATRYWLFMAVISVRVLRGQGALGRALKAQPAQGEEVAQALEQFHVPGVSTQWPIPWPLEVAGNCLLLERLLQGPSHQFKRLLDISSLPYDGWIYVGINPLLPPPLKAAPDFMDHWPASELLRNESYVLLQVEHHFAVFAHTDQLPEAWQRGWFCSPLAPVLLSLEQLAGFDETWLSIGALPEKEAAQEAAAAACRFLRLQGLRPEAELGCRPARFQGLGDESVGHGLRFAGQLQAGGRSMEVPGCAEFWGRRSGLATALADAVGVAACIFSRPRPAPQHLRPWRGPSCDVLDAGSAKAAARSFQAAVHYIVNEDPVHLAELRHSLRNLWQNYNSRFDYPVQIFHDGLSEETRTGLVQASPNRLWFHHLPKDFLPSVNQLPSELVVEDAERHVSHHTFSVGYRAQCRFRSGPLFEHPAVVNLDYLMSLDTDSMLTRELERDPIEDMHRNSSLVLGYAHLTISSGAYSRGLWAATLHYLAYEGINLTSAHYDKNHFFSRFLTPHTKHEDAHSVDQEMLYHNLVVMTDLELLRVAFFKPGSDYFRFYRFVDELGGFWLYRWGDHAVRGLGTAIALFPHEDWSSTPRLMAYDLKMPYAHQAACFCHGANLKCKEQGQEAAGEVLWPAKKKVWRCVANNTA
ncbi:unnamed protein product [Effrenium voratum]|nr:unnamed protein product [Effrenium voratum]